MQLTTMFKIVVAYIWVISFSAKSINAVIGINWGRQSVTTLIPSMVVDVLLQNGVSEVKLFSGDPSAIKPFANTDIGVTVTISAIRYLTDLEAARKWIARTLSPCPDVNFRYVSVGNNAFAMANYNGLNTDDVYKQLTYVQTALDELGFDKVKAIMTHSFSGVLVPNITVPSKAEFLPGVMDSMLNVLNFSRANNVPFVFDVFPIAQIVMLQLDYDFAFLDNKSKVVITDEFSGLHYTNVFDFVFDCFVWALKKVGFDDLKIVVGQIGWPTDGYEGATTEAAERFWKYLLPVVVSNRGTPMRPGVPIDIYVHSLNDEKRNPSSLPFARHWGIYRTNGEPKYKIDLTGQGRDIFPSIAHGTSLMPGRWCVFTGDMSRPDVVKDSFELACLNADCTSLSPGGSCSMLTYAENVSYAFNAYFQTSFQDETACVFNGLGEVVQQNPSRDGCVFSVEVVKGNQPPILFALKIPKTVV